MKTMSIFKKKSIVCLIVVCVIAGVIGVLFLRLRNGVRLQATVESPIQENMVGYRQDDEDWAKDTLGGSKYTMESSGCLVCCVAAAITMNDNEITPGELNDLFSANEVYDTEGNMQWGKVGEIAGYHAEVFSEVSTDIIENCLNQGRYPIARVRIQGIGSYHYVLIVGSEAGEYMCMDPLRDEVTKLSEYGNRVYALRCVWYEKPEDIALYETYYLMEKAEWDYLYTYYDCDKDGKLELLLKQREAEEIARNIMKYENNGLRDIYTREFEDFPVEELEWFECAQNEQIGAESYGIDVCVCRNGYWNWDIYWYLDKESFLKDFGFAEAEPFYEYMDEDGNLYMSLYYDEHAGEGCGIIYAKNRADYGFAFSEVYEGEWKGTRDYFKLESVRGDGDTGEYAIDADYQEDYEYDSEGRLVHCESTGIVEWFSDEAEQWTILEFDYEYDENGKLEEIEYWHNAYIFGTWYCSAVCYFDELERIEYEYNYITHGSQDWFYIYSDDSAKPDYVLMVDPGWDCEFIRYKE